MSLLDFGALASSAAAIVAVLSFWMRFSDRITKANANAESALQVAAEADEELKRLEARYERHIKECTEQILELNRSLSQYRETAVEKFVTHSVLSEVEKRLVENQVKSEARLTAAIDGLIKRLDRVLELRGT